MSSPPTQFSTRMDSLQRAISTAVDCTRAVGRWLRRWPARLAGFHYLNSSGIPCQSREGCGPASLFVVLNHYGLKFTLPELERQLLGRVPGGTRIRRMAEFAEGLGFTARLRRVGLDLLPQVPLPSIAVVNRGHYIVLERRESGGHLVVADPLVGRCRIATNRFLKLTNGGEMLLLAPRRDSPLRRMTRIS